jgi:hypothetical protein
MYLQVAIIPLSLLVTELCQVKMTTTRIRLGYWRNYIQLGGVMLEFVQLVSLTLRQW